MAGSLETCTDGAKGSQSPSPDVVCTAIIHSTTTQPITAKECVQQNSEIVGHHPYATMVLEDIQPLCHGTRDILTDILVC